MSRKIVAVAIALGLTVALVAWAQSTKSQSGKGQVKGSQSVRPGASATAASLKDKASYGIGLRLGQNLKMNGVDTTTINADMLLQGLRDALSGTQQAISDQELDQALSAFEMELQKTLADKNQRESEAFLAKNKARKGVVALPSGLQYEVVREGTGKSPKPTDTVRVHYHGTLLDGTVFDSSVERNEPAVFAVNEVIRGWTEALPLMKVGGKWRLYIPANLAYGPTPPPGTPIGPNSMLIFDVELLGIEG